MLNKQTCTDYLCNIDLWSQVLGQGPSSSIRPALNMCELMLNPDPMKQKGIFGSYAEFRHFDLQYVTMPFSLSPADHHLMNKAGKQHMINPDSKQESGKTSDAGLTPQSDIITLIAEQHRQLLQ